MDGYYELAQASAKQNHRLFSQAGRQWAARLVVSLDLEKELYASGCQAVAGVDEAGRGPLAGPVVAAAVILPRDWENPGVDDSKKLKPAKREQLAELVMDSASAYAWGLASAREIDEINIHQASLLAMGRAMEQLVPDFALVDGRFIIPGLKLRQRAVVGGDGLSCSIAAASILAKVKRDQLMARLHLEYPQYDFAGNKGYPTARHLAALEEHGPCPQHRMSYGPVARVCSNLRLFQL